MQLRVISALALLPLLVLLVQLVVLLLRRGRCCCRCLPPPLEEKPPVKKIVSGASMCSFRPVAIGSSSGAWYASTNSSALSSSSLPSSRFLLFAPPADTCVLHFWTRPLARPAAYERNGGLDSETKTDQRWYRNTRPTHRNRTTYFRHLTLLVANTFTNRTSTAMGSMT